MVATPDEVDEQTLVAAAQADPARFLDLYDRHFHRVYAYVLRRTRNRADAEDVTADVFQRALANIGKYEWRGVPFVAWLYRIAGHELADRYAARARPQDAEPLPAASDPEFEQQVALFQLVDRLPGDQQRVIELRSGEGRSIREVAAALGRSDRPYGERSGFVRDAAGNRWFIATPIGPSYFAAPPRTVTPHLYVQHAAGRGGSEFVDFLAAAFDAHVEHRHDMRGRIVNAVMRIHGAALEIGEGDARQLAAPAAFLLEVNELEAAYQQALAAGATTLFEPRPHPPHGRMAGVADRWGNEWLLSSR
jgi:RNA polymerase sigma-70 factor (ECF subfamily)